jgi:hypothetical protein
MKYIKEYRQFLNEDWFDEYLAYEKKVFAELRKRLDINPRDEDDLATSFGAQLEKGWKKNTNPKKLAFQLIPRGQTYKLTRWG